MIKPFISQTGKWVFDFRLDWNHVLQMTKSRKRKCFFFFFFFCGFLVRYRELAWTNPNGRWVVFNVKS
jgi:hypothetical protein